MIQDTVFIQVKVTDELPENGKWHPCIDEEGKIKYKLLDNGKWYSLICDGVGFGKPVSVTHWLKPIQSVYVLTEEELEEFFDMAQSMTRGRHDFSRASAIIASMTFKNLSQ